MTLEPLREKGRLPALQEYQIPAPKMGCYGLWGACIMNKGQIVYRGTPADLRRNEQIQHTYLGV